MAKSKDNEAFAEILGMLAKNSTWDHKNEGLPSDPQILDLISQKFANNFAQEFKNLDDVGRQIWDGSTNGYMLFIAIVYKSFHSFVGGLWNYSDDFLEDLGLNKYQFEDMLIQAGSLALFMDEDKNRGYEKKLFALPFKAKNFDVYNNPIDIEIVSGNSEYFGGKTLKRGEYVILKQNENSWNKLVENAPFLTMAYRAGCELHDDITRGQNHYIMLADSVFDSTAPITTEVLNDFSTSRKTMLALSPQPEGTSLSADPDANKGESTSEKFKNAIQAITYIDRSGQDFENYLNVLNEALKYLGVNVNMNSKKKERQITGEIAVEAEIPSKIRAEMFYLRKRALEEANKLFSKSYTIEEADDDPETIDVPDPITSQQGGIENGL